MKVAGIVCLAYQKWGLTLLANDIVLECEVATDDALQYALDMYDIEKGA